MTNHDRLDQQIRQNYDCILNQKLKFHDLTQTKVAGTLYKKMFLKLQGEYWVTYLMYFRNMKQGANRQYEKFPV